MLRTAGKAGRRWLFVSLILYLSLRVIALTRVGLLEDRDSGSLIRDAQGFATWDLTRIIDLRPDATPLYPLLTAVVSLPGLSLAFSARLVSWLAAGVLALALVGVARQLAAPAAAGLTEPEDSAAARDWSVGVAAATVALLALNPTLVDLSRSVLTEGLYVAVVYGGLLLLLLLCRGAGSDWRHGAALGALFALAFLARTEGLVFLVAIPVIQLAVAWGRGRGRSGTAAAWPGAPAFLRWSIAYFVCFGLLALPQIWRVSRAMGQPAINGRQVWQVILNQPDEKPYEQKIYGLDHSPSEINLVYIQSHPVLARQLAGQVTGSDLVAKAADHGRRFLTESLPRLIAPLGLLLAALGIIALWRARRRAELVWMGLFLGAGLAAPLLHDLDPRHLAVALPLLGLLQGIGLVWLAGMPPPAPGRSPATAIEADTAGQWRRRIRPVLVAGALAGVLLGFWADLAAATLPPSTNRDYALADQEALLAVIHRDGPTPVDPLRISARQGYLSLAAGAQEVYLPFADYEALVTYCRLNRVDLLLLEHDLLERYPFLPRFAAGDAPDFRLMHRRVSPSHGLLELYRFTPRGGGA